MQKEFIYLHHGYISIPNYNKGECPYLENILSWYDETYHNRHYDGMYYNEETKELRIPLGFGANSAAKMLNRIPKAEYIPDEPRPININLTVPPRDAIQSDIIRFVVDGTVKYSQAAIVASTGIGKTYCAIASAVSYKFATLVICHRNKLRVHWGEKIPKYTSAKGKNDILILDSSTKMLKLLDSKKPIKYKFISTTHAVLASFAKRYGWEKVRELTKRLGIGFLIIDEVHRCFANTIKILTHTNVKKYLLLTATFKRSNRFENRIFHSCFSCVPKYVQANVTGERSQKHISGMVIEYNSSPSMEVQLSCESPVGGISSPWYVNWVVEKDPLFYKVFASILGRCVDGTKPFGGKGMVMCGSIHACGVIAEFVKKSLGNDIKIGVYNSGVKMKESDKIKLTETCDLIITTSSSLGEGTDMDKLHYVIDIETYRSEILAEQIPGRLRDLKDGHYYHYIKICNIGFTKVANQLQDCIRTYEKNMKSLNIIRWKPKTQ